MELGDSLRDAHVAYVLRQLRDDDFAGLVDTELTYALARGEELTLTDAVTRDQVKAVAHKYVALFALPGAIPEIAGDIAARVRAHPSNTLSLADIVPQRNAHALIAALARIEPLHRWLLGSVAHSPSVQMSLATWLRSVATGPIESNLRVARRVPGVASAISLGEMLAAPAAREADLRSRELSERAAAAVLERWRERTIEGMTTEEVAGLLTELWHASSGHTVGDLLDQLSEDDLVDMVANIYDWWLDMRTSEYLADLIDLGVDYIFDTYGSMSLTALLDEFGLTKSDLVDEALRFAPRAIDALDRKGVLEDLVRRQVGGFYDSPEARAVLG